MRIYSNTETYYRVYPSTPMTPCSIPHHHGEAPRLLSMVISLPCIHNHFKPHLSLKHSHRHRHNHNRYSPRLRHHNNLTGRNVRHLVMVSSSVSYRLKRTCGDYSKNVALRMGMHNYCMKPSHLPLRRPYGRKTSSR